MTFADWPSRLRKVRGVLVDSNILIDAVSSGESWYIWSRNALEICADHTDLVISPIVYAEMSISYESIEDLDAELPEELFRREPLPWAAAFLAGKSFLTYRKRGGLRRSPLPDFYIGAHAAASHLGLLTRDAARYRTYFPRLPIFAPPQVV